MTSFTYKRQEERGNALFLILIAVALFAALSFAVSQSGRGGGTVDRETAVINSSQITQYPAAIRTAVTRMILTGTTVTNLDFVADGTSAEDEIFAAAGGGALQQTSPPPAAINGVAAAGATTPGEDWRYKSAPVTAAGGFFLDGVGTDDNEGGRDSFVFVGINVATCQAINRGLGLSTTIGNSGTTVTTFTSANEGEPNQAGGTTATSDDAGDNLHTIEGAAGEAFACTANATSAVSPYVYFHALVEQ